MNIVILCKLVVIIAERLSARHVIAEYCVEIVCLYIYIYICYAQTMDRDNPWIALLKVWIRALRGQSMDCPALARSMDCATTHVVQKKKGDQSRERKGYLCLSFGWRTVRLRRAISG